jgi:hypothetical protein
MRLEIVANHLYEIEGAESPDEFIKVWNQIHPYKKFDPDQIVWVHFFIPIGE